MSSKYNAPMAEIGKRIVRRREELRITAAELAIQIDVPAYALSLYESGQRVMGVDKLLKIATALHVPLSYFELEGDQADANASAETSAIAERLNNLPPDKRKMLLTMITAQINAIE